jgi:hypothetical protein
VANLYLDEDVHHGAPAELQLLGHSAVHGAHIHRGATDDVQLLEAVRQARVLITSNARDFILLHHAWTHWSRYWVEHPNPSVRIIGLWGPTPHSGILIVPNGWAPGRLAALIDAFFRARPPSEVIGRLYRWIDAPAPRPGHWRELLPSPLPF